MKKIGLSIILLIVSVSLFPQSKAVLSARIETLSAKIDALRAEMQLVKAQNQALTLEIATLKTSLPSKESNIDGFKRLENQSNVATQARNVPNAIISEPDKTTSKRCKAITNAGTQCTRNVVEGSDYCWQHKSTYEPNKSSNLISNPSTRQVLTGPRGGKYYINSNGNKTYIKK